ncbi:AbrB family transcriptional regulator [Pontibacillus yanchengensis]|uniref:AbrB family transcriptional regulator n=2 Tax=Pontibacillus yanchengensis TaxID=462910 RepID=A0A6I4ZUI8_9BACI|nr:AbrB family transcriptional regulator [Pontibacillus yanchengensis]
MEMDFIKKLVYSYIIGAIGGSLFVWFHMPLPWVLGAVTSLLFYKTIWKQDTASSIPLKNISFALLGVQLGSSFTEDTFQQIGPYIIPYLFFTCFIIAVSLFNGYIVSKWLPVKMDTSMLGSIPGGLSASIALSDSLQSNTVLVTIFHTIRLVAVLFIIPFSATHFFYEGNIVSAELSPSTNTGEWYTIAFLILSYLVAVLLNKKIPAAYVMIPMFTVGILKVIGVPMMSLPDFSFIWAQITLGVYLGNSINIEDLMKAGKYCMIYFGLSVWLIIMSFCLGYVFSQMVDISIATAILSIAPGGLIEMALTAQSVGGDPSIVSSLQMVRLLIVVMIVPIFLQWFFRKMEK